MMNDMLLANNKAKGQRPYFLPDPAVERVLNITMAVATELAVTRERLDTLERLLEANGALEPGAIDRFEPSPEVMADRQRWHAAYIARILRLVQQELEAVQQPEEYIRSAEEIAEQLGKY